MNLKFLLTKLYIKLFITIALLCQNFYAIKYNQRTFVSVKLVILLKNY